MRRWPSLALLCLAEILAMSTWFSTNSVMAVWKTEFALTNHWAGALTSSVSVGFVLGAVALSITGTADRFDCRRLFAISSVVCAIANASSLYVSPDSETMLVLRLIVGASAAGIYPIGIRLASMWAVGDMGLLVGLLVGAQVVGLSLPHLVDVVGGLDWRVTIAATSLAALASALIVSSTALGPQRVVSREFSARDILAAWTNRSLRLANIGYLGHMWELFAMWGWIGLFLQGRFLAQSSDPNAIVAAKLVTFTAVAAGAIGCIAGGRFADRFGRTTLILASLVVSGGCALILALFPTMPLWLLSSICIVWGLCVVADSPQFSAAIVELSPKNVAGTMILTQVALGFSLTVVSIQIVPTFLAAFDWSVAFAALAIGPAIGIVATVLLRREPDARLLASGKM